MTSNSSFRVLLAILALGAALVTQAAGRPWGSWANSTIQNTQEEEGEAAERVTIPSFLLNYTSPLDAETTRQYAALWENHTLGQHIEAFCRNANLLCDPNITIGNPRTNISRNELDDAAELFHDNGEPYVDGRALQLGEKDFVEDKDIVLPESLHGVSNQSPSFLPDFLVKKMPLSSEKIQELLDTFHILHDSKLANMMFRTVKHCEVVKEKTSKEIEVTKEKEITEKEVVLKKERGFEGSDKYNEKDIKEKKFKENVHESKKENSSEERKVEGKKTDPKTENKMRKKEEHVKKEKLSEEKKFKGKEIEYKNKEVKEKEKEVREKYIHENEKKSNEVKSVKEKEFKHHKGMEKKDFHKHEGKASEDKKVKEKVIEHEKEMELKKKDIHRNKEKSWEEKMIKEKEIIHNKEKESKEEDFHVTEEKALENKKVKKKETKKSREERNLKEEETKKSREERNLKEEETKYYKEKELKDKEKEVEKSKEMELKKKDVHGSAEKSELLKEKEIEYEKEKEVKEKDTYVKKEESSKEIYKCVTSLEGMTSFVKKSLPKVKHIKALERSISTKHVDKEQKKMKWKVLAFKKYDKAVVCKSNIFLFAVFKCHDISKIQTKFIYHIELEGMPGHVHRKEILACKGKKDSMDSEKHKAKSTSTTKVSCEWVSFDSLVWAPYI